MEIVIAALLLAYMAVSALVCQGIAKHKNRGTDEWFVCGVIFGIFAIVVVGLLWALPAPVEVVE